MASGIDQARLSLLLAVLEKRVGLSVAADDVFVNVAGGLTVNEPAADLGILAAVASSLRNRPVRSDTAMFGEVGLAGEVRGTPQAALRIKEAHGGQVAILNFGSPGSEKSIRKGLAMGCDRALQVTDALDRVRSPHATAEVLARALDQESFDLILAGTQSEDLIEELSNQVNILIADLY